MQSRGARAGLLIALAAVAVALFVVLSGGDDEGDDNGATTSAPGITTTAEPAFEVIRLANGVPVGGARELSYDKGDRVRIRVIPDPGLEEIHLHGYEIERVPEGQKPLVFDFTADLTGGFELEAHGSAGDVLLANIKVQP